MCGNARMRYWSAPSRLLLALVSFCLIAPAFAGQDCRCGGTPTAQPHKGGDGKPLKWEYEQYIVRPASGQIAQLICYRRRVENDGSSDVRDIHWQVANFFRSVIRKGDQEASCPDIPGEVSPNPSNGPIHFGPGPETYDTTVFQPKNGWDQSASLNNNTVPGEIRTALSFDMADPKGTIVPVTLNFSSAAGNEGKSSYLISRSK
jgi:hypothetical protein